VEVENSSGECITPVQAGVSVVLFLWTSEGTVAERQSCFRKHRVLCPRRRQNVVMTLL